MKILIIDDDEVDRMIVVRTFKNANIELDITQAENGIEGIALASKEAFDIILLDYRLPDMDGIEVIKELNNSHCSDTTVIMLSGEENPELARNAIDEGAQDFFLKSEINADRLMRTMAQAKHRHSLEKQLKNNHEKLRELAEHDPLTGLSNRYDFERALNHAVERTGRAGKIALLLLDIDKFKHVNDTYGHAVGDQLLIEASKRLTHVARHSDLVARLGGDEFVILMQDFDKDEQAILLANRINKAFEKPMQFEKTQWVVTTSIGISLLGDCAHNAEDLLKCADIAMYRAKQEGRNQSHFYSQQLHDRVRKQAELEKDIRNAIKNKEFTIHYQAQVNSTTREITGIEALIRWNHPTHGLLPPDHFLPIAEEIGLMSDIGAWVLNTSCLQMKLWQKKYPDLAVKLAVAVNLSAIQLHGKKLSEQLDIILSDIGLSPQSLELEITENALIRDTSNVAALLSEISKKGIRIALDDFGTGFSSFEHLKLFPIDRLKIDKSFVADIGKNEKSDLLFAAMVNFGCTLGLTVIAEGIETEEQAEFCEVLGCNLLQGYLYSMPSSAMEFENQFLKEIT